METRTAPESFRSLLLRHRGRTGLIQRDLAARAGVSRRAVQEWEAGDKFPGVERLQALIRALLEAGGLTSGREVSEARELWAAAERQAPRMHTPFDEDWFAGLVAAHARVAAGSRDRPPSARTSSVDGRRQDWGEAPDTIGFVGRAEELALLRDWVLEERCRLLALLGMGGIGKTMLAARLAQQAAPSFERVYWRSVRNAPLVSEWLAGAIGFLSDQELVPPSSESERITALVQVLRARRCLLVLDNAEAVFEAGQGQGRYRAGMAGYGQVLQTVGEAAHQSCLVLTSREAPPELSVLGGSVRALALGGFSVQEVQLLIAEKKLQGDPQAWLSLVERYDGNGLALKIVGETILQVYDGDVAAFLGDATARHGTVFGGIRRLLDAQIERLSPVENNLLRRLAVEREPISLAELSRDMPPSVARSTVVEALETLRRRSLVERGERGATFTLQSMVLEYVTDRLVETVADEIERGEAMLLLEQPLIKAQAKDYVRQAQERLIGAPILQRLEAQHAEAGTESRLLALLDAWRGRPAPQQGDGPGNVVNLVRLLRGNLRKIDLSRLALRHVYLQGVEAQDASLAGARLADSVLDEPFAYPTGVALSVDARLLATGTPTGEVGVWRVADRTPLLRIQAHLGTVWGVVFSGDGRLLASGGVDGVVKVWETDSGQLLATLRGESRAVYGVALTADGRLLASGGDDGVVRLWEVTSGQLLAALHGHAGLVWCVALSRDGRLVASGSMDGTVRLWDSGTGQLLSTLHDHTGGVWGVAVSADGRLVASGGVDGLVRLWDSASGQLLTTLQGHTGVGWGVALSGDGRLVVSGSMEGTARLWDAASGHLLAILQPHTGGARGLAFSGDGRLVASGNWDGTVTLSEGPTGRLLATLHGHTGGVRAVALSADGRLLASGSMDGTIRLWETDRAQVLATLHGHTGGIRGVALSGDGRLLASGGDDGLVRLWEVGAEQLVATLQGNTGLIYGVAFSGDRRLVASCGLDGAVRVWATETRQLQVRLQGHTGLVRGVALSGDGRLVASGGLDGTVRLWDSGSGQVLAALSGHRGSIWSVAVAHDGRLVASGDDDGMIRLWETASGRCLRTLRSDRRYQRLDITGLTGVTGAQRAALRALGAVEKG